MALHTGVNPFVPNDHARQRAALRKVIDSMSRQVKKIGGWSVLAAAFVSAFLG